MSHTYKYPRGSLDGLTRDERVTVLRIEEKLERQKEQKKRKRKIARSFKAFICFRDRHWAKGL